MHYPPFFDQIPPITLHDPLTRLLGVNADGRVVITYLDSVKLAGHSCPTTAGAFLMVKCALAALYQDTLPVRGDLRIEFKEAADAGTTGVTASIASLITGASDEKGFKGLGGRFARNDRLFFARDVPLALRLTRLDNGKWVDVGYNPAAVPVDPLMATLMKKITSAAAQEEEMRTFGRLWQERVKSILLDFGESDKIITVREGN